MTSVPLVARAATVLLLLLAAATAGAAVLSSRPLYHPIPAGTAVVTLTFTHGAERRAACRRFTPEEIARMPPNMRRPEDCPRGRLPVLVELELDGRTVLSEQRPPAGLAGDGPSHVYRRFVLPAGGHEIAVRLRDTARPDGFDRERRERVALPAERNLVIDFRPDTGFVFH
jgi:hypothetical protein